MIVKFHPHAKERARERGATEDEIVATVERGEQFPAKHDRTGFRRNFAFNATWNNRWYAAKQIEAYAVEEEGHWLVLTVIVKFY